MMGPPGSLYLARRSRRLYDEEYGISREHDRSHALCEVRRGGFAAAQCGGGQAHAAADREEVKRDPRSRARDPDTEQYAWTKL
ncbi:unnamed protein product [Caretta caretta]